MAPVLSLPKTCLDRVREAVSLAVVSIWELDEFSGKKISCRSGFIWYHSSGLCIAVTLRKGLDVKRKILARFENGQCFEGFLSFGGDNSNLAAIILANDFSFEPKSVPLCNDQVRPGQDVVHMGFFDETNPELNFSSGTIALVGHNTIINNEEFTRFVHCCSEKLHLLGGPVFSLKGEVVGVNYSKKDKKNLYFALDCKQLAKEIKLLFGENGEYVNDMVKLARKKKRRTN
ncbi:unnamed protein product [Urochloa decumbens]|uniref:Serine protease n=1 Tax=Urochloa decumbens TaxID=240449 RepID=A0ABC8VUN0_9POAL